MIRVYKALIFFTFLWMTCTASAANLLDTLSSGSSGVFSDIFVVTDSAVTIDIRGLAGTEVVTLQKCVGRGGDNAGSTCTAEGTSFGNGDSTIVGIPYPGIYRISKGTTTVSNITVYISTTKTP